MNIITTQETQCVLTKKPITVEIDIMWCHKLSQRTLQH